MGGGSDIYVFEMLMVLSIQFKLVFAMFILEDICLQ